MTKSKVVKAIISFCFVLFAFVGCVEPDYYTGAGIVPGDQDITIKTVEFDLPVEMKMADSLQASSFSILVGSLASETFGRFDVSSAAVMTPGGDSVRWGKEPVFKSMQLRLKVSEKTTFDTKDNFTPQNIKIYPLNKALDTTFLYCNSISAEDYDNDVLCETVYAGQDSLVFNLPERWAKKLLEATNEELDSIDLFVNKYFGLYFECESLEDGILGGRINHLDLNSAIATLNYNSINSNGVRRDTTAEFNFGKYRVVNTMSSQSGKFAGENVADRIYVEGMNGVKPYLNGKKLYNMLTEWAAKEGIDLKSIVISRAKLEFPFECDNDYDKLNNYPAALYPCTRLEGSNFSAYYPIAGTDNSYTDNGTMNRSLMTYSPDAGTYFQTIVRTDADKIDSSYDLWIMPLYKYVQTESSSSDSYYDPYSYYNPYGYGYGGYSPYGYGYGGYGGYGYGGYGYPYGYGGYSPYGYGYGGYGGYGYGGYGYGGYGYPYGYGYGYGYGYDYGNSTSTTVSYFLDNEVYSCGILNGTSAERHPKLKITYTVLK